MIKLLVKKIEGYNYYLVSSDNREYMINMEFYSKEKPIVNDSIYLNEVLLKERVLSFDYLDSKYGNLIIDSDDKDLMILVKNDKKVYLKRVYG